MIKIMIKIIMYHLDKHIKMITIIHDSPKRAIFPKQPKKKSNFFFLFFVIVIIFKMIKK